MTVPTAVVAGSAGRLGLDERGRDCALLGRMIGRVEPGWRDGFVAAQRADQKRGGR